MTANIRVPLRDLMREADATLLAHRLRTTLSAIGLVCGVATVMTALAIGEGARRVALEEIGALGVDNVLVRTPVSAARDHDRPLAPVLSLADADAIGGAIDGVRAVSAARVAQSDLDLDARRSSATVAGVTPAWREITDVTVARGRWLSAEDERAHRRVAVAGATLARELFGATDPVGARVRAGDTWYYIVGVLRDRSSGTTRPALQTIDTDRSFIVPLTAMDASLGEGDAPDRVQEIAIRVMGSDAVDRAAQAAAAVMKRRHRDDARYEVIVPRELLAARLRAQRAFDAVLIGVGLIALIISGVGIMNIMLASVAERTQEIGVRRAFGARRAEITTQFALEAAVLCVAGGIAGVPLGAVLSAIVAMAAGWPVSISMWSVVLAIALAAGVGMLFGIYPARVAASITPIEALRTI
jgi:putative ABC transport system permease protein